jgi:protein O-GlcNAc transferase
MTSQENQIQLPEDKINSILNLYSNGKITEAIKAIKLLNDDYPNVPFLFNLLGACYESQGHSDASIQMFRTAVTIKPDYAEAHFNLGVILKNLGQFSDAVTSYKHAISYEPKYFDALNNLGNVLFEMGLYDQSIKSYYDAISVKPDFADANYNLARVFNTLGRVEDAEKYYRKAISIFPDYPEALNNLGVILRKNNNLEEALLCFEKAENIKPDLKFILGPLLQIKKNLCLWDNLDIRLSDLSKSIMTKDKSVAPFFLLGQIDNPALQRKNTENYVKSKHSNKNNLSKTKPYLNHNKIRIGYFSADFHNHATMHLMTELFECHNKDSFEIIAFSFGPNIKEDKWRERVYFLFDEFIDVTLKTDLEISELVRAMEVDIAVDLKGFTKDSRPGIFMERCAPIQINYLGYPGTMGADFIDYLIADQTLIPEESQKHYSEKIIYMPESYQVNMAERKISKSKISRNDLGLPEKGFVFCCFNNTYKISPSTFHSWMRILNSVKGSTLWLFVKNKSAIKNLQNEAEKFGINKARLVFASFVAVEKHLNRIRHADLFIDTLPYNAHTTASDALRVGVPVITCLGSSFASRVAASLLNSLNMSELITSSQKEYESLAIELATDTKKLKIINDKLKSNLSTSSLYNPALFTQNLEVAYRIIYDRYHHNLDPDHIYLEKS